MTILIFTILFALAVAVLVLSVGLNRGSAAARAVVERLRRIAPRRAGPMPELERDRRYSVMPWMDEAMRRMRVGERLERLLDQAAVGMRAGTLILTCALFAAGGYIAGLLLLHRLMPALVGMAAFAPLPLGYVWFRKQQRMRAFAREFPDALDLLVSALRAGLSFTAAMQIVAEEAPEPVRGEFAVTVEEQSLGLEPRVALLNLTRRVDVLDLRFFVTAVMLQRETGGNLAEVLQNTSVLIRDRFRVLGDIQTYTAQGKLTGLVLVCLPIFVSLFTLMVTPDYFRPMLESPEGRVALWGAGLMQLAGILAVRKIVSIRV